MALNVSQLVSSSISPLQQLEKEKWPSRPLLFLIRMAPKIEREGKGRLLGQLVETKEKEKRIRRKWGVDVDDLHFVYFWFNVQYDNQSLKRNEQNLCIECTNKFIVTSKNE